jgi:hypothetical protein
LRTGVLLPGLLEQGVHVNFNPESPLGDTPSLDL